MFELRHTNFVFNIRVKNIKEKWRIWSKLNHHVHLKEMSQITWVKKTWVNHPIQISKELRRIGPNTKVQILKTRPTSRVGAVTWKVTSLTFYQDPQTIFPGLWGIWSGTLGQPTVIVVNQPSRPRHWLPSPN